MLAISNSTDQPYHVMEPNTSQYEHMLATNSTWVNPSTPSGYVLPEPPYPPWGIALLSLIAGITSFSTVLGNILVVVAFILEKHLRQPSNYLIASLAITDILIGLFSMPLYTVYLLMKYWPLGQLLCDLWLSLDYTVCLVSQYTVFLITLDRFCSVKAPAKYRNWRTTGKIKIMIAATWLVPALIFFTSIMGWRKFTNAQAPSDFSCAAEFQNDPKFSIILVISYYWVTLIIMTGLYIGIYKVALSLQTKARQKRSRMKQMTNLSRSNNNDFEPLNKQKHTNGTANKGLPRNNSSRLKEDSDFSNDHSSDSIVSRRNDSITPNCTPIVITPATMSATALSPADPNSASPNASQAMGSPLWKPRDSIPASSINWEAFSDSTYSTLQRTDSTLLDATSQTIKEESNEATEDEPLREIPPSPKNKILGEVTRVFTQINKVNWRRRNNKESQRHSPKTKSKSENRARKALRTITFILGAFVICWTPYHVVVILYPFCKIPTTFFEFTYWLCYMNSPINPFCYALSNQQFKRAFLKILRGEYFRGRGRCFKGL